MTHQAAAARADLLDIVFANRNRAYGAYQLRRTYPDALARALGGGFFLIATFFAAVHLLAASKDAHPDDPEGTIITFDRKPTFESKPLPKPVLSKPAAPARRTLAFLPPIVAPDDNVPEVADLPTQEDLAKTSAEVGAKTQDGTTDGPPDLTNLIPTGTGSGTGSGGGDDETVYDMGGVHKPPYFPGGEKELLEYIAKHIKYPAAARESGITGPVVVSFVVNTDGSASDIAVLKDPGGGCGKEVIRVVSSMPKWVPGESNGHPVRVRFYLPVRFELD
ncbi:MAG: TonB family protein [Saprospiraceae bacterium]